MKRPKRLGTDKQGNAYNNAPRQERAAAKRLGGRTTPASGSLSEKGDVRIKGILRLECKSTEQKSFSVTRKMLQDITDAGELTGEVPAIEIDFLPIPGQFHGKIVLVPVHVLDSIVDANRNG